MRFQVCLEAYHLEQCFPYQTILLYPVPSTRGQTGSPKIYLDRNKIKIFEASCTLPLSCTHDPLLQLLEVVVNIIQLDHIAPLEKNGDMRSPVHTRETHRRVLCGVVLRRHAHVLAFTTSGARAACRSDATLLV